MSVVQFTRPPIRYVEMRSLDRRRGLWQAYYAGDEWTQEFITTIGQRWMVEQGLRGIETFYGLPVIVVDSEHTAGRTAA